MQSNCLFTPCTLQGDSRGLQWCRHLSLLHQLKPQHHQVPPAIRPPVIALFHSPGGPYVQPQSIIPGDLCGATSPIYIPASPLQGVGAHSPPAASHLRQHMAKWWHGELCIDKSRQVPVDLHEKNDRVFVSMLMDVEEPIIVFFPFPFIFFL